MVVADARRFALTAGARTLVGRRQARVASQLGGRAGGKVQMAERRFRVRIDGRRNAVGTGTRGGRPAAAVAAQRRR